MVDFDYAAQHLRGVWRLLLGHEDWRNDIDQSEDGVFRSLWAVVLTVPFSMLGFITLSRVARQSSEFASSAFARAPLSVLIVADLLSYVILWAGAVALMAFIAIRIGASDKVAGLIVSFNWSRLLSGIVAAAPSLAYIVTGQPELFSLLAFPVIIFSYVLLWSILRQNLPLSIAAAISFLFALTVLSIAVNSLLTNGVIAFYQLFV